MKKKKTLKPVSSRPCAESVRTSCMLGKCSSTEFYLLCVHSWLLWIETLPGANNTNTD